MFWQREYTVDSGGKGRLRGGLGQTIVIRHRHGDAFVISKMFDRIHHPARGRGGAGEGGAGAVFVTDENGAVTSLPGKGRDVIPAGAELTLKTPGGGGLGPADERDAVSLQLDRQLGLTSR